jgi:hypothetical protein
MEPRPHDPFELIAIVYSQDELALLTSRLHSEGIWVISHSAGQIAVDVGWTLALGGVKLFVHREQAGIARDLLRRDGPWERTTGVYVRSRALDLLLALMLALVAGVATPARIQSILVERRQELISGA